LKELKLHVTELAG